MKDSVEIISVIATILIAQISYAEEYCRYSISDLSPSIKVKVDKDTNGIYTYNYTLRAETDSKFPLGYFFVKFGGIYEDIKSPLGWQHPFTKAKAQAGFGPNEKYIRWLKIKKENMIAAGQELSGFIVTSTEKPALTMAKVRTQGTGSPIIYSKIKKVAGKPCPGIWDEITSNTEQFVRVLTLAPASENQVSLSAFARPSSGQIWSGTYDDPNNTLYNFSPFDKKDIEILVVSDDDINVKDLDTSSLRFGRGEAKPKSVQKITISDQKFASENETKSAQGKDALLLSFSPREVNPLCNVDLALFLKGKMKSGKNFFSGVAVKKTPCTEENWKIEAEKILTKENSMKQGH